MESVPFDLRDPTAILFKLKATCEVKASRKKWVVYFLLLFVFALTLLWSGFVIEEGGSLERKLKTFVEKLKQLSSDELQRSIEEIAPSDRRHTVCVIVHLVEIKRRNLRL